MTVACMASETTMPSRTFRRLIRSSVPVSVVSSSAIIPPPARQRRRCQRQHLQKLHHRWPRRRRRSRQLRRGPRPLPHQLRPLSVPPWLPPSAPRRPPPHRRRAPPPCPHQLRPFPVRPWPPPAVRRRWSGCVPAHHPRIGGVRRHDEPESLPQPGLLPRRSLWPSAPSSSGQHPCERGSASRSCPAGRWPVESGG